MLQWRAKKHKQCWPWEACYVWLPRVLSFRKAFDENVGLFKYMEYLIISYSRQSVNQCRFCVFSSFRFSFVFRFNVTFILKKQVKNKNYQNVVLKIIWKNQADTFIKWWQYAVFSYISFLRRNIFTSEMDKYIFF